MGGKSYTYRHLKFSKLKSMFWDTLYIYMYSLVSLKVIDGCLEYNVPISHVAVSDIPLCQQTLSAVRLRPHASGRRVADQDNAPLQKLQR